MRQYRVRGKILVEEYGNLPLPGDPPPLPEPPLRRRFPKPARFSRTDPNPQAGQVASLVAADYRADELKKSVANLEYDKFTNEDIQPPRISGAADRFETIQDATGP